MSPDTPAALKRFAAKEALPFPLLSDPEREVLRGYGLLKEKMMYGRRVTGVVRTTAILDGGGVVRKIFQPVKPPGHGQEVVAALLIWRGTPHG